MLNIELNKKVILHPSPEGWIESSTGGVRSFLLEQSPIRETLLLDYRPGVENVWDKPSCSEEILVLEGTFTNADGEHPAGTYLRNPEGTLHKSISAKGCRLFVKLTQRIVEEKQKVRILTHLADWRQGHGNLQVLPLYSFGTEGSALVKWPAGERFVKHTHFGGEEIFVLQGEFIDEFGRYPKGSWIRSPHLSQHFPYVDVETIIFVKTGHLLS